MPSTKHCSRKLWKTPVIHSDMGFWGLRFRALGFKFWGFRAWGFRFRVSFQKFKSHGPAHDLEHTMTRLTSRKVSWSGQSSGICRIFMSINKWFAYFLRDTYIYIYIMLVCCCGYGHTSINQPKHIAGIPPNPKSGSSHGSWLPKTHHLFGLNKISWFIRFAQGSPSCLLALNSELVSNLPKEATKPVSLLAKLSSLLASLSLFQAF